MPGIGDGDHASDPSEDCIILLCFGTATSIAASYGMNFEHTP
jgi:hypothetical protein